MRYRRLGRTDLMVSGVGLDVRSTLTAGEDAAESILRAGIEGGITVLAWDVSDAAEDVEPLIARAAGLNRGRLTLVATLDYLPPPGDLGPQVEAITARLGEANAPRSDVPQPEAPYLDVIALPGVPDEAQLAALADIRARGLVRFAAYTGDAHGLVAGAVPAGIDVLALRGAPSSVPAMERADLGLIAHATPAEVPALLAQSALACVVTAAKDRHAVWRLLVPSV